MIEKEYNFRRLNFDKTGRRKREEKKTHNLRLNKKQLADKRYLKIKHLVYFMVYLINKYKIHLSTCLE